MMHSLPNLRYLYALRQVTERGGVSAAARAMHLTQRALTQAITAFEADFGGPLFARSAHGMDPTEAGRLCAERVGRVIERIEEAVLAMGSPELARVSPMRAITSGQLQALAAVIEAGGFGAAARAAGLTRATLHRSARELAAPEAFRAALSWQHTKPARRAH